MRDTFNDIDALSEAEKTLTRLKIEFVRRPDGSLFVPGEVDLSSMGLTSLPDLSQVEVGRNFYCSNNELTSLKGAPRRVGGNFHCGHNQLLSLEYGPETVGKGYHCQENQLVSLRHAPLGIPEVFSCTRNRLRSLKYAPRAVKFMCCEGNALASLEHAPSSFEMLRSDFGEFARNEDIPKELRLSPATRSRREGAKKALLDDRATVLRQPLTVRPPLRFT